MRVSLEWRDMALDKALIDKLLEGYEKPEDLIGEQGLLKQLTKALVERALNAELTHHLGYEKNDPDGAAAAVTRVMETAVRS